MARVPIEIVVVGTKDLSEVSSAMALANAEQDEFAFQFASNEIQERMQVRAYNTVKADDFFDQMESIRTEVRGFHPFVIAAIDAHLDGKQYSNLFGSHRADKGIAVVTTDHVVDVIIQKDRMAAYFIYYFARYALSFLSPTHRNHEDSRGCVFDRKVDKRDIVKSMRARALCDDCRRSLVSGGGALSASQLVALERLFSLSGRIFSEGLEVDGRPCIFVGSSSEGLDIANKLQELLSGEFSVVVWNQGTVFGLGTSTLEALEAAVLKFHHAVFVFTADDELNMRGEVKPVARDNVLFELGMFIGKLGRKKAFVVHPGKNGVSLPSDLAGSTTAPYDPNERNLAAALGPVSTRIRNAVRGDV